MMENGSDGKPVFSGYCIDLLKQISEHLNFEYEISLVPDREFGTLNDKGEWNGMIRELIDKVRDLIHSRRCKMFDIIELHFTNNKGFNPMLNPLLMITAVVT